jgi:hypothetical protein
MNEKYEQFIGIYEDAFSKEYCDNVINFFNKMEKAGYSINRQQNNDSKKIQKDDLTVYIRHEPAISLLENSNLQSHFNDVLWGKCYLAYADKFSILRDLDSHNSYSFKIQKTEPGQGFHVWHCESWSRASCHRLLVWTLYLNDVEEGGETEFIYQHLRIKPKTGTLVIWPSEFTHTHRGNPPISNVKYIVTGWIEF